MRTRAIVAGAVAALVALHPLSRSLAQDSYPSKTITMIVPFPAGGSTDVIGRLVAEGLRARLGQPVVVDNRAGAGGSLGTAAIAKAAPDGYTIGMGTASTLAINPATYKNLPYDVLDGSRADRQHRRRAQHHVGASRREGRHHGGVHRAREVAAGQAQSTPRRATARSAICSASSSSSRPAPTCCTCPIAAWGRRSTTPSAARCR